MPRPKKTFPGKPDSIRFDAGAPVSFRSSKWGVTVYRQRFNSRQGGATYAAPWYCRKTVSRKTQIFPLGLDPNTADSMADEIAAFLSIPSNTLEMAVARYNPRAAERALRVASIGDVISTYHRALNVVGRKGKSVGKSSYAGYRSSMLTFIRKALAFREGVPFESWLGRKNIDASPWLNRPVSLLTARLVSDFKLACTSVEPGEPELDEEELLTAKISADSCLRNARAFFSKAALRYYSQVSLEIPDMAEFLAEPDFGAKKYFELLPLSIVEPLMRDSLKLRDDDLDAYRGFILATHCGLRHAEIEAFQTAWLREEDRPMLYVTTSGDFTPKHGRGRKVGIEQWVAALLADIGPIKDPSSLANLNVWLREHGVAVNKPLHELRKLWVSYKAKSEGLLAAQQQAGHRDPKTTTMHYADNMLPERLLPFWKPIEGAA